MAKWPEGCTCGYELGQVGKSVEWVRTEPDRDCPAHEGKS